MERFWESVNGTTQFLTHPVRLRPIFRSHCIPLSIHGDGTPVVGIGKAWGKLLDILGMAVTSTAEENLKTVWLDILDWYRRLGVDSKFVQLKPTMLIFCVHSAPGLSNPNHWGSITMDGKRELDRNWTVPLTASQNFSTLALEGQILSTQAAL